VARKDLTAEQLTGELVLDGKNYPNLEELNLERYNTNNTGAKVKNSEGFNKITKAVLKNFPKLKSIDLDRSLITTIELDGDFNDLTKIDLQSNPVEEMSKMPKRTDTEDNAVFNK
ncbi:hypothetical protein C1645_837462, partial [Glomus cerebriforme]